jgi:hypothetical protein
MKILLLLLLSVVSPSATLLRIACGGLGGVDAQGWMIFNKYGLMYSRLNPT